MTRYEISIIFESDDDAESDDFNNMITAAYVQVEDADGVTTRNVEVHVNELHPARPFD